MWVACLAIEKLQITVEINLDTLPNLPAPPPLPTDVKYSESAIVN